MTAETEVYGTSIQRSSDDHVCIITHGDGANPIITRTLTQIAAASHAVTFLCWNRLGGPPVFKAPENATVLHLLKGCGRRNLRVAMLLPVFWIRAVIQTLRVRPRLIYAHAFEGAIPAWIAHRLTGVPYIYHVHDNFSISHKWPIAVRRMWDAVDEVLFRDSKAVVLPDICRLLPSCEGSRNKVVVIPNSTDVVFFVPPVRSESTRPLTVAALGSLEMTRGVDLLLAATKDLRGVRVAAGHIREKILAKAISRQSNWDYLGVIRHAGVERVYREADVVFLFYKPDLDINRLAVPMKLSEALSVGRPILMNEEVKLSKRVRDWGVGYTCAYESRALRACLEEMSGNRFELLEKASRARTVYDRELSWETHAPKLKELLRRAGCQGR
jgi:glycosyltransferase involved in cell wall biosynthesis